MSDIRSHSRSRRINRLVLPFKGSRPCFYCGAPAVEVDHLVPVVRGGRHERANLVPACRRCNASKGKGAAPRQREVARSVFSTQRNHTPTCGQISLPTRRREPLRGDFTAGSADARR